MAGRLLRPCLTLANPLLDNLLLVLLALALVALNGFFVAAEFGLVKLRHTQAATLAAQHGWRGRILLKVRTHLDAYLSACQLGITFASLGLGWIGEPAFSRLITPMLALVGVQDAQLISTISLVFAFTLISFLHIVVGELAPKSMAIRRPQGVALWTAAPLYAFYWLMYPAIRLLNASALGLLRMLGMPDGLAGYEQHYSRDELKLILHSGPEGESPDEYSMMTHALELGELVVGDLLRPRDQLASLRDGMGLDEVLAEFRTKRFSRYPWFDDSGEQVRGVLHMKDLLHALTDQGESADLISLLRPPMMVSLSTPVLDVLQRFRHGDTHLALGHDDAGRVLGFVTLEDVIEVVVGDIQDEQRRGSGQLPKRAADGSFIIAGGLSIYRLEKLLGLDDIAAPEDVNSVGGLIVERLERLPDEGETLGFDDFSLTVCKREGARLLQIRVSPHSKPNPEESP